MKGLTTYKITTKERLKSIAESKKVNEVLLKHYTFIFEHFDEIIAKHDDEIAKIEDEKAEVLKQFIEAPQLLKELNQHLAELAITRKNVSNKDSKVKRVKVLRQRLSDLENQLKKDGINIDDVEKNIEDAAKEDERVAAAEKIIREEAIAADEAEKIAAGTMR